MTAQPIGSMPSPLSCSARIQTAVEATATAMPAAERRLPLRAVAGEFIRMRPMTKATAPASQPRRTRTSMVPMSTPLRLRLLDGPGRRRLLPEHLEHPVGHDIAADDVHRPEGDRHQRKGLADRIARLGGDDHGPD